MSGVVGTVGPSQSNKVVGSGGVIGSSTPGGQGSVTLPNFATLVATGDSFTFGVGASDSAHQWLTIASTSVGAGAPLNQAISGTILQDGNDSGGSPRASNGRGRFASTLLGANKRAGCFIAYGYNDSRYIAAPATLNATLFENDYREMLNGLIVGGYTAASLLIVSPFYITDVGLVTGSAGFSGQTRAGFLAYVTKCAAIADEFGVYYIDMYQYMLTHGGDALISGDNTHPNDTGHAVIAAGVLTASITNARAKPTAIVGNAVGTTITTTLNAPAGSVLSYEYELISNSISVASNTTGIFSGLAGGSYYVKARAVFTDGKSPWSFASAASVVSAPSLFLSDSFSDTAGVALTSHTPEVGGGWVVQTGWAPATPPLIDGTTQLYSTSLLDVYRCTAVSPSADYYVEAVINCLTALTNDRAGVAGRMNPASDNFYYAVYTRSTGLWGLNRRLAGVATSLGTYAEVFTTGTRILRLSMVGSTIKLILDGVERVSVTDANITAAGCAGIAGIAVQAVGTGMHYDSIVAQTL